MKSLGFQLFLYPCAFFMCVISSFNVLFIIYYLFIYFYFYLSTFLLNAVNFPETAIPFSISFKGKFNKRSSSNKHPSLWLKFEISARALPWVPEVFLACSGNFLCWPKAEAARKTFARVTIKTWQKLETALEKSLAPRVPGRLFGEMQ